MGRPPCCDEMGLKKGPWTPEEDRILTCYIHHHGHGNWRALPKLAGLMRCGKSCRLRWINYLRPDIKRGNFTKDEEETIIKLHQALGNRWSTIAARLPGRTDNEIKNFWHTNLKKRTGASSASESASPTPMKNIANFDRHYYYDQSGLLTQSSYHQDQQQPIPPMSEKQQCENLLAESHHHHHNKDDENHMDFWYTLFVKAEDSENTACSADHHEVLLT